MSDVKKIRVKFYFPIFLCLISIGISEPVKLDSIKFEDKWLAYDKVQHFTFSFLWTLSSQYILVNSMNIYEQDALTFSVFSSLSAGIMKDGFQIRRAAVEQRIPCFTSIDTARAALEAVQNVDIDYKILRRSEYLI